VLRVLVAALFVLVAGCSSLSTGAKLDIVATEYAFDPATIPQDAHTVALAIHNQGQEEHDFELIGPSGNIVTHMAPIQPGITKGVSVALTPGTYRFVCTLEDHAQHGMSGTLIVR
jgi:uncharacterized cupredoxin-like copper-binding protein